MKILEGKFPSKGKFYRSLTSKKIIDKNYENALKVWNAFDIKIMKDYHDLYLKCDVLLIADVCEKFRNNDLKIMDYIQAII